MAQLRGTANRNTNSRETQNIFKAFESRIKNLEAIRDTYEKESDEYISANRAVQEARKQLLKYQNRPSLMIPIDGNFDPNNMAQNDEIVAEMIRNGWSFGDAREQAEEYGIDPRIFRQRYEDLDWQEEDDE